MRKASAAMKQVLFTAADGLVLRGRHRSSVHSHQQAIEFFFLVGALVVTPGLCVLLLLFFVRVGGAALLLVAAEAAAALVFLESSAAAKAEMDVARVARVSIRIRAVFMRVSPFSICNV